MITASPLGEEEAAPEDEERGTVAVPVPEATRGRGSGEYLIEIKTLSLHTNS